MTNKDLQPRHKAVVRCLTATSPKRYTLRELSAATGVAVSTLRNELPVIMQLESSVERSVRGKEFKYYVARPTWVDPDGPTANIRAGLEPLSPSELLKLVERFASPDYIPGPAKQAWQVPLALSIIYGNPYELPATLEQARQAIEDMADGYEANALKFRQLLITPQTKEVEELARQLKENSDRLRTSYQQGETQ